MNGQSRFRLGVTAWVGILAVAPVGCAYTKVSRYEENPQGEFPSQEECDEGVRYYENAPFILVYATRGHYASELVYLPDTSIVYSADPVEILASNQLNLTLEDGVLTEAQSVGDATRIPKATISALKSLAEAAAAGALDDGPGPATDSRDRAMVYLFRVGVDESKKPKLIGCSYEAHLTVVGGQ